MLRQEQMEVFLKGPFRNCNSHHLDSVGEFLALLTTAFLNISFNQSYFLP